MSFTQKLANITPLGKASACTPNHSLKAQYQPCGFPGTLAVLRGIFPQDDTALCISVPSLTQTMQQTVLITSILFMYSNKADLLKLNH